MKFSVNIPVVDHFMTYSQYFCNQYFADGYLKTDFMAHY